ncbi:DUF6461 domain-containing protein [Herbidospora daliensis]|uniref:DUF6461 domain-containing protein n=1 Tax=Herbidospora daliensis TaxID=295585 RepID=UPI000780682D|nr:DUF6461 domain-containing protein [Herbidospora daliensis]
MTTTGPLAPFEWLDAPEGEGELDSIFTIACIRGLTPAEIALRFSRGADAGQTLDFAALNERSGDFLVSTDGGEGGGHVGILQVGEWCVVIEPNGWMCTLHEVLLRLSQGCEVVTATRHDYAEHSFAYAVDGTVVMEYNLFSPYERSGADPDRLNAHMRDLGMALEEPEDDDGDYEKAVAQGFALVSEVSGVPLTSGILDRPMLVTPFVSPLKREVPNDGS